MKAIWRVNPYGPKYWPSTNARDAEKALGITRIYYPMLRRRPDTGKYVFNELQMDAQYAKDISMSPVPFEFAVFYDPGWDGDTDPKSIAKKMSDIYANVGNCKAAMFDIEYHNCSQLIIDLITEWRKLHPTGPISWTLEPHQAGWFTQKMIDKINNDVNMVVVVQTFYYNMAPAEPRNGMTPAQQLLKAGIKQNRICEFYNGARVNEWKSFWNGCILGEETLPTYNT